ncbi:NACHT domain-containing protein [Streptomyces sp. BP-8]|uniref:NACHT domain-containing protein n=1 Tax=Streptomyces sirii TaxID=3127701 RepID=A0ABZ2QLZ5_9ACTN
MDPASSIAAALAGRIAGEAVQPLLGRARRELIKRGVKKPRDAASVLAHLGGPHQGDLSTLGLLDDLPTGVTNAQIKSIVEQSTFTALARQLIAIHLCTDDPWPIGESREEAVPDRHDVVWRVQRERIEEGLGILLSESLPGTEAHALTPYLRALFAALDRGCRHVAASMKLTLSESDGGFSWAGHTLELAAISSVERHLAALRNERRASAEERERWQKEYLAAFLYRNEKIELPDLELRTLIPYREIFVEPNAAMLQMDVEGGSDAAGVRDHVSRQNFAGMLEALDRTVILGDPGAGKSTVSQVLACQWCERHKGVAFLLKVRQIRFSRGGFNLVEEVERALRDIYQKPAPPGMVEELLLNGSALVIFDGLDEVPTTVRGREVSDVIEAASIAYPLSRFVVTSRRLGYSSVRLDQELFCDYALRPFSDGQVKEYAGKWFVRRAGGRDATVDQLVENFMEHSRTIHDLRQNPLMLAVICLLHAGYNEIPRSRPKIYKKCVELLLRTWDSHRGIGDPVWDIEAFEVVLAEIAYHTLLTPEYQYGMTKGQVRDVAVKNLLEEAVPDRVTAVQLARRMIDLCRGRAWMFTDVVGGIPGEERYSFTHQSFQEYFAAQYLVRHADSPEKVGDEIARNIASGRLEIFSQICLSLASGKFPHGASLVYQHCLAANSGHVAAEDEALVEFLAKSADIVMLNGSALQLITDRVVQCFTQGAHAQFAKHLLRADFRHADSMQGMVADAFARLRDDRPHEFTRIINANLWAWENCLQEGVIGLGEEGRFVGQLCRLFDGGLYQLRGGGDPCTAMWVMRRLAGPATDRPTLDRCARMLEQLAALAPYDIVPEQAPAPPYALFKGSERSTRIVSTALMRSLRHSVEARAGLAYLTMAFCELMAENQPGVIAESHPLLSDFMRSRTTRQPRRLPQGVGQLPKRDQERIRSWAAGEIDFFEWIDDSVAVS